MLLYLGMEIVSTEKMDSNAEILEEMQNDECKLRDNQATLTDSKRSWLVCLGAVFLVGISMGVSNSFGVLFARWTREFQESRTKIGR